MIENFISILINFISNRLEKPYEKFTAFLSKKKQATKMRKLKRQLALQIKDKCQNEVYYNALDKYLSENDFYNRIVDNSYCFPDLVSIKISLSNYVDSLSQRFISQNPQYAPHQSRILMILKEALQIAFNDINDYREDNSIRAGVNFLSQEHALIYEKLESLYDKSNLIETNEHINDASNINITGENIIKLKTYLCNTYTLKSNYISRNIFSDVSAP